MDNKMNLIAGDSIEITTNTEANTLTISVTKEPTNQSATPGTGSNPGANTDSIIQGLLKRIEALENANAKSRIDLLEDLLLVTNNKIDGAKNNIRDYIKAVIDDVIVSGTKNPGDTDSGVTAETKYYFKHK